MKRSSACLVKLKRNAIGFARRLGINITKYEDKPLFAETFICYT